MAVWIPFLVISVFLPTLLSVSNVMSSIVAFLGVSHPPLLAHSHSDRILSPCQHSPYNIQLYSVLDCGECCLCLGPVLHERASSLRVRKVLLPTVSLYAGGKMAARRALNSCTRVLAVARPDTSLSFLGRE